MKNKTISRKIINTVAKGKRELGEEAIRRITGFVESQRAEDESFVNKSGKADLYYTAFGWLLSLILDIKLDVKKMAVYLALQDPSKMDMVHYTSYIRCRMLQLMMKGWKASLMFIKLFSDEYRDMKDLSNLPHGDLWSPYSQYIRYSLAEDTGYILQDKKGILESLASYRSPRGGYANIRNGMSATTNATVAALSIIGQIRGYDENIDANYLREQQEESGGFKAAEDAPVPDILSTATALFTLNCYGMQLKYPPKEFIEAHWLDSGGFSATLLDDTSDVEYTFYGLLALGASN